jgi:GAF domain-containing protein
VPVIDAGRLIGVLDLDSPIPARFDQADADGCVMLARLLAPRLASVAKPSPNS